ncbi:MAG: DUF421 domain-containing protein [bacterium]
MGKREIGQLGVIDLIVSILIAELVAISIENYDQSIVLTIIPILVLMCLEIVFAYISMKSKKIRKLIEGKNSLIVCSGKVNYKEMIRQRYSLDDLLLSLRQISIKSLEEVEYAFLEKNGKLSIFKYEDDNKLGIYPMPVILDGEVIEETLKKIRKNKLWLNRELEKKNLNMNEIFYAFYKEKKLFIINKN